MSTAIRTHARRRSKLRGGRFAAVLGALTLFAALIAALLVGCTAEKRYKVLSVFFDGVPDPNAPFAQTSDELDSSGKPIVHAVSFAHKPYEEGKCDACHGSATGNTFESFQKVDDSVCGKCHEKVQHEYPRMHGPVALGQCSLCHVPHESSVPSLLKDNPTAVCSSCHLKELLPASPPDHLTDRNCLDCHSGHGGTARGLLKAGWNATSKPINVAAPATNPTKPGGNP